jgi:hypothetical protein
MDSPSGGWAMRHETDHLQQLRDVKAARIPRAKAFPGIRGERWT